MSVRTVMSESLFRGREMLELFTPGWYCDHCSERFTNAYDGWVFFDAAGLRLTVYCLHDDCREPFNHQEGINLEERTCQSIGEYAVALASSLDGVQAQAISPEVWYGDRTARL